MAIIFYGISNVANITKNIDKWIGVAGEPDVFCEKDENLTKYQTKLLGKYEVISIDEALKRYPNAGVWVTYRIAKNTASLLLSKMPHEKIHFLEADLEYRKGCRYLGNFMSYRKNSFSPCCVTGQAPIVKASGSIRSRFEQWQSYTTDLVDKVRNNEPNDCQKCPLLKYGFWRKSVKLNEINFGSNQPGDICNFRCTYCFCENTFKRLKDATDGFTTYEILQQLSEMPEYDTEDLTIQLANGEFCANKHCDDMLDIFMKTKWKFSLLSNFSLYREKLAKLMETGRITRTVVSLDAGTRETFKAVKRNDRFDIVLKNIKRYPIKYTKFCLKYVFIEGVNDNEADIDGFYEIAKDSGAVIMISKDMNVGHGLTDKMRELTLRLIKKAKADGIKVDGGSGYLNPADKEFIKQSYANA